MARASRFESRAAVRPFGDSAWQQLDRDGTIQPRVARLVDLAHPAGADRATGFRTGRAVRRAANVMGPCGPTEILWKSEVLQRLRRAAPLILRADLRTEEGT